MSYYKGKCQETFLAVEGALLSSQHEPRAEIVAALRAVVRFASNELEASDDAMLRMMLDAIEEHRATVYEDEP